VEELNSTSVELKSVEDNLKQALTNVSAACNRTNPPGPCLVLARIQRLQQQLSFLRLEAGRDLDLDGVVDTGALGSVGCQKSQQQ
jgi:hypothetical protein